MTHSELPRIEINLAKISHNAEMLLKLYGSKGIELMGVTKGVCGSPEIAKVLVGKGMQMLGDSKVKNLKRMHDAGIHAEFVLLRSPALSEIAKVIQTVDVSLNSELIVMKQLSEMALKHHVLHKVILMIELGDLREGILPENAVDVVREILQLRGIRLVGIGANFACFGGVKPTEDKMNQLSLLATQIESEFNITLPYVSGGNSANYSWFIKTEHMNRINNLRIGESILLGRETLYREAIPNLFTDAFTFVAEVIESKMKPSVPYGEIAQNVLGISPEFEERGEIRRIILGVGFQDVLISGLTPKLNIEILGSSSDHTVMDAKQENLRVGDEVSFSVNYGALLTLMTSENISKKYINMLTPHAVDK
ncbi:MAG: alanine/ornithine racemase family PLP-dependent enzyme [Planococcaceae bacterium]|nr:alanine/ornithine racemase family PLP-dependent enzyme [Planococcaceae bacterium]